MFHLELLHTLFSQINWWPWSPACLYIALFFSIAIIMIIIYKYGLAIIKDRNGLKLFIGQAALEAARSSK